VSESATAEDLAQSETLLSEIYDQVIRKLREHEPKLVALAKELTARQELTGEEAWKVLAM
jgi:phage baseplate assembly protein W